MKNKFFILILLILSYKVDAQKSVSALEIADSLYILGDYSNAMNYYKQLPVSEHIQFKLAKSYEALGDNPKAIKYYKNIISGNPTTIIAKYNYGRLLFKTAKFKEADSVFSALSNENKNNPNFVYQRGLVKEKLRDTIAIYYFQETYNLDNNHIHAIYKIGKYYIEKRRFKEGDVFINKGLETDSLSIRFLTLKALKHYHSKEYHHAIKIYEELLTLGKKDEKLYLNLAISYGSVLRFEDAIKQYTILLNDYDDKNSSYHYNLGLSYLALHYIDKAKNQFNIAIALKFQPLDKEYVTLAMLYKREALYKQAMILYKQALRDNPKNEMASYQLAVVADIFYEDKKKVLIYYNKYLKKFGETGRMRKLAKSRVSDLKKEIHFND